MKEIRKDASVINAQFAAGYESSSGFHDTFATILGVIPERIDKQCTVLKAACVDTVLGPMIAIADEQALYLLEFGTRRGLEREIERLRQRGFAIIAGTTAPIKSIMSELKSYFAGQLQQFKTPYRVFGSSFQQQVWDTLCRIPYGEMRSYAQQALLMGKPTAYRAVANANGMNQLAIIIPCHRIISSDGSLGGYGGGIAVKQWLLEHEQNHKSK